MDVRLQGDCIAALAGDADLCSLGHCKAALDARRAELEQRHGVAIVGRDRDRSAATRDEADERDGAGSGSADRAADLGTDVDAAVLAAGVGVVTEHKRAEDRPVERPRPGASGRRDGEHRQHDRGNERSPHWNHLRLSWREFRPR